MSSHYLHVKSREPMAGSPVDDPKYLYFFVRTLSKQTRYDVKQFIVPHLQHAAKDTSDARRYASARLLEEDPQPDHAEYEKAHPLGTYAVFQHKHKYRMLLSRTAPSDKYVLSHELAKKIQRSAYEWRQREVRMLNQYQPLILYPNSFEYWRELLRLILTHPVKYPTLTGVDKVLFALCWHSVPLFYDTRRNHHGDYEVGNALLRDPHMTRLTGLPRHPVPPDPAIAYAWEHYRALWQKTYKEALERVAHYA